MRENPALEAGGVIQSAKKSPTCAGNPPIGTISYSFDELLGKSVAAVYDPDICCPSQR